VCRCLPRYRQRRMCPRLWCRVLSRRVRDPNRIAFLAARGVAVGPSDEAGTVPAWAAGEAAASRRCCMGTSKPPWNRPFRPSSSTRTKASAAMWPGRARWQPEGRLTAGGALAWPPLDRAGITAGLRGRCRRRGPRV